jgi:hypothetical protein
MTCGKLAMSSDLLFGLALCCSFILKIYDQVEYGARDTLQ